MSYCTKKVASLPLQQELNQFQNQVQSKVNQWKGKEKTEFIGTSKQSNDQSQTKEKSFWMTVWWNI